MASLAPRSIFIQTYPVAKTLSESKSILSSLQKFGRVVTFRNLRYDTTNRKHDRLTNSLLAIFESPQSAERAVSASPVLVPLPESSLQAYYRKNRSSNRKPSSNPLHPWPSREEFLPPNILCHLEWSRHNHQQSQMRNPYHSFFEPEEDSAQFLDLRQNTGLPVRALGDCRPSRKRIMKPRKREAIEWMNKRLGTGSLWGIYEQGLKSGGGCKEGEREGEGKKEGEGEEGTKDHIQP